jgi:hypothetical protein
VSTRESSALDDDFAAVPDPGQDAVIDPHWLALRGGSTLPALYMPPAMGGRRSPVTRVLASFLIAVFMLATSMGVCLTYGAPGGLF